MKKLYLLSILSVVVAISQYSCKPDDDPQPPAPTPFYAIPQVVKDYSWFNVGTYWVYEDSATGQLDSIGVYNAYYDTISYGYDGKPPMGIFEEMSVESKSTLDQTKYFFDIRGCPCLPQHYVPLVKYVKATPGWGVDYSLLVAYPFTINRGFAAGSNGIYTLKDSLETYTVANKTYSKVLLYHNVKDETLSLDSTLTWVAKGYGIIRKQSLQKNKTFWLKRSRILK